MTSNDKDPKCSLRPLYLPVPPGVCGSWRASVGSCHPAAGKERRGGGGGGVSKGDEGKADSTLPTPDLVAAINHDTLLQKLCHLFRVTFLRDSIQRREAWAGRGEERGVICIIHWHHPWRGNSVSTSPSQTCPSIHPSSHPHKSPKPCPAQEGRPSPCSLPPPTTHQSRLQRRAQLRAS